MFRKQRVRCPTCAWSDEEGGEIICTCMDWEVPQERAKAWHFSRQGRYCYNYVEKEE